MKNIKILHGRYGLGSAEFTPGDVISVIKNMESGAPINNFVVGIDDDLTGRSLPRAEYKSNDDNFSAILYGIGSDGTVGAVKNIVKIIGENSDLYPQSYAVYDSKKSGGLTASHLRVSDSHIKSQYLVGAADFISVSNFAIAQRYEIFDALKDGGIVMINGGEFSALPTDVQKLLVAKRARIYFLDAARGANELGLGNRINTFILMNFFNLTRVIEPAIAAKSARDAIEKTYRKKGAEIVAANWGAVDRAGDFLAEFTTKNITENIEFIPAMRGAPDNINRVLGAVAAGCGGALPVSAFARDGEFGAGQFPVGTSKYEKRGISERVASVDLEKCIQCGKCSMLCPHAVIRINAVDVDKVQSAESRVQFVDSKTKELGDVKFTLNISPADCTGCGVCVENCPVRALSMKSATDAILDGGQIAFDAALELPEFPREKLNMNIPKHIELTPHYFEFPGACAGCGETPYLKLLGHLFGDRMVVANATGCSSIYGGNLPTTPWTRDRQGRGPAWSNSLFEDNAEYGLGMRLAIQQRRRALRSLLNELAVVPNVDEFLSEKDTAKQRENEKWLREKLANEKNPLAASALSLAGEVVDKSVWIVGGDGWAYDIGYGGLDHILHSGQNVNILVLDTEGYSNTGGQSSKATPFGASMKFAVGGKASAKKDLGNIAMQSGAYVAQIALGANQAQAVRAIKEAEAFDGPSIILAYCPCISHGYPLKDGAKHQVDLVRTGAWPLYRFNPDLINTGDTPLHMDMVGGDLPLGEFLASENRFGIAKNFNPDFDKLVAQSVRRNEYRRELKKHIASFAVMRDSVKENGEG
ncbi:MAG: 2-oxoacid:acceptor oxidoreductase family protein [Rickettsiales bacterium]|jgi:pyruvate-ferredoxin/flavodoxin oxidoreductase|nr:2-oxoacid:acceptor oxidoreductase family protein [Rickettsiales bacterium]